MNQKSGQWSVVSDQTLSRRGGRPLATGRRPLATAFSLVELLIVVAIIVLLIGLSVPALNLIRGTRSLDSAENQVSAMLGVARVEAIGRQQHRGVMFYYDPVNEVIKLALVQEADPPSGVTTDVDLFLDLADADALSLPKGVGAQIVDDPGTTAPNDRFIGYNDTIANPSPTANTSILYGGVILFDRRGQLASKRYAFKTKNTNLIATSMGNLMFATSDALLMPLAVAPVDPYAHWPLVPRSQVGLILFDLDAFRAGEYNMEDLQIVNPTGTYNPSPEQAEEAWLDQNGVPLLVNRYNGTLIKGE